jgi:hypothetical protein
MALTGLISPFSNRAVGSRHLVRAAGEPRFIDCLGQLLDGPAPELPGACARREIFSTDAVADCQRSRISTVSSHSRPTAVRNKSQIDGAWRLNSKVMSMMKKLMLILILGMIMSGPAAPILKSFLGFGATAAYAAEDDDNQGDNDNQGEDFGQ